MSTLIVAFKPPSYEAHGFAKFHLATATLEHSLRSCRRTKLGTEKNRAAKHNMGNLEVADKIGQRKTLSNEHERVRALTIVGKERKLVKNFSVQNDSCYPHEP